MIIQVNTYHKYIPLWLALQNPSVDVTHVVRLYTTPANDVGDMGTPFLDKGLLARSGA